jgi:hypothetical protein
MKDMTVGLICCMGFGFWDNGKGNCED